ncbi:MAG: NAD(P)H-binding protein [Candidatus Levybacteria bacterium]|nr:NAD(P)H-binding protein [Candidatus Levybacteria bacterium]
MKRILLLGATGHLGKVLTKILLKEGFQVVALVRSSSKVTISDEHLKVITGDVTNSSDLNGALENIDVVISTLGHGFRTPYPIQEKALSVLIPLMEKKRVNRFITITGAGLAVKGDPKSFLGTISSILFPLIDPYRISDAKAQQLILEKSNIDWTVVRTPIHNNRTVQKLNHVGLQQPMPWQTISRAAISIFMASCIKDSTYIGKAPIIY